MVRRSMPQQSGPFLLNQASLVWIHRLAEIGSANEALTDRLNSTNLYRRVRYLKVLFARRPSLQTSDLPLQFGHRKI
jgi:hypothetical protein